jgi:hypothetical protein
MTAGTQLTAITGNTKAADFVLDKSGSGGIPALGVFEVLAVAGAALCIFAIARRKRA